MQKQQTEQLSGEAIGQSIRDTAEKALAALQQKRERDYAAACADFAEELRSLARESDTLETEIQRTTELLAATERVTRFEADQLIVQGKNEQARAKLSELQESKGELARIEGRRSAIATRCREIETEKTAALRRGAEEYRDSCVALIRACESGLAGILDTTRDTLNVLEMQTGGPLYQPANLTAPEKSAEWRTLRRLYAGRTR